MTIAMPVVIVRLNMSRRHISVTVAMTIAVPIVIIRLSMSRRY